MTRRWTNADDALLAKLTPAEIQRQTGRSLTSIQKRRWRLRHKGAEFPDYRQTAQRRKAGRSAWTPAADKLARTQRPHVVVKRTGIPMPTVLRRRKALGLPPIGYPPKQPKPPRKRPTPTEWTKQELRIALSMPPRESVKLLPGRSLSAIETVRCLRKRDGLTVEGVKGWKYGPRKTIR